MTIFSAYALLIGIGTYAYEPQLNLPSTVADAQALAALLQDPQFCGYPPERVRVLAEAAATREGVLTALDDLAKWAGESDTVLIFFAGHGAYSDNGYALTTHDSRWAGPKVIGGGLSEAELITKLRTIRSHRLLLIVNACVAGDTSLVPARGEVPLTCAPLPPQVSAALLGTGKGRMIISACRENQRAFIGPGPLTLFTQVLVDGLQGRGVNSNHGYISVFDLYTHLYFALDEAVARHVPAALRQHYGERQESELSMLKGGEPFAVALYRGAPIQGKFDSSGAPPEGTAVREVNPAYSQAMLRQQDEYEQRGAMNLGSGNQIGDLSIDAVAGRDIVNIDSRHYVTVIQPSGGVHGPGADRNRERMLEKVYGNQQYSNIPRCGRLRAYLMKEDRHAPDRRPEDGLHRNGHDLEGIRTPPLSSPNGQSVGVGRPTVGRAGARLEPADASQSHA